MKQSVWSFVLLIVLLFQTISATEPVLTARAQCTSWFGCHKGFCWAGCSGAFSGIHGPEWCYTKDPLRETYKSCTSDDQCVGCWRCGGICSI